MELSYLTNQIENSVIQNNPTALASQLPIFKRNYLQYTRRIAYNFGEDWDMHYTIMCSFARNDVRIYTTRLGFGTVCLQATSPEGEFTLLMDNDNPKKIIELPDDWTQAEGYDQEYGINLAAVAFNPVNHAANGYYRGWASVKKDGNYATAFCKSQDGIDWNTLPMTMCDYDDKVKSMLGSWRSLMAVCYDQVNKYYYGVASGVQSNSRFCYPVFVTSTDGVNWEYKGIMPTLNNVFTQEEFQACSITKIGSLYLVGISRYDFSEGVLTKNPVWCYSADDGKTWNTWNMPFLAMTGKYYKYPSIYCTPNYIYMPFVYIGNTIALSRMEWNNNPAVTTPQSNITNVDTPSDGFVCNQEGGKDIVVTLYCNASKISNIEFNVYPVIALGHRMGNSNWRKGTTPYIKEEIELAAGVNMVSFKLQDLPHLWNFSIVNKTADSTISSIEVEYVEKLI